MERAYQSTVLVTGASGFVGRALCNRFARSWRVRAAVRNLDMSAPQNLVEYTLGELDIGFDWGGCLTGVDAIVHCASLVHVSEGRDGTGADAFERINVRGTIRLAQQAATAGVKRFVFLSSIGVNGDRTEQGRPFNELSPPAPRTLYAKSKLAAEKALRAIAEDTGLEVVIVRPPMVYGANAPGNFQMLRQMLEKGYPLPFGAIHNRRDFVGIDNLTDFLVTCAENSEASNQTFLVSDGSCISTTQFVNAMASCLSSNSINLPIPAPLLKVIGKLFNKDAEVKSACSNLEIDISKAQRYLGWSPAITIEDGLARALSS